MDFKKFGALTSKLCDLAYVVHAVPARRLRRVLPKHILPETFEDSESGEELGLIMVTSHKSRGLRPAVSIGPSLSFPEVTYQCLISNMNHRSVYHFGSELGSWSGLVVQKLSFGRGSKAKININIHTDNYGAYDLYDLKAHSSNGDVEFEGRAKHRPREEYPFENGEDKVNHFFNRSHHFSKMVLGTLSDQTVEFTTPRPWEGEILSFKCDYWVKLGLLKQEEIFERFYCFLVAPKLSVFYYPHHPTVQSYVSGL